MANDAVAGNSLRVAPADPTDGDDPVRAVLAAYTKDLVTAVQDTLAAFLATEVDALREIDAAMGGFAATARDCVLAGGKRVRPTFAYWGGAARRTARVRCRRCCPPSPPWSCCTPSPSSRTT